MRSERVFLLARYRARVTGPPGRAGALAGRGVARATARALAHRVAVFPVLAPRTRLGALSAHPTGRAIAPAGDGVAHAPVRALFAHEHAIVSGRAGHAVALAGSSAQALGTDAPPGDWVTRGPGRTLAPFLAALSEPAVLTLLVAPFADPPVPALAPPVFRCALGPVGAVARLGAVGAKLVRRTRMVAPFSRPPGRAQAPAVRRFAISFVHAVAHIVAGIAKSLRRTNCTRNERCENGIPFPVR